MLLLCIHTVINRVLMSLLSYKERRHIETYKKRELRGKRFCSKLSEQ